MKEQRVIKFRVILNDKIIGYEKLTEKGWQWMCPDLNPDSGLERWIPGVFGDHSPYNRDQFTGLHDKAGNEIYEDDIVALADPDGKHRFTYIVRFEDAKFVLYHTIKRYGKWGDLHRAFDPDFSKYNFVKIGNLHQHKHLLK
jgi:hypothetical protein